MVGKKPEMMLRSRKAFISEGLADFWAFVILLLVIIIFYIVYKIGASAREQALADRTDMIYGNYLAQVYLRLPVVVGGEQFTMAELIAFYDYNQSLETADDTFLDVMNPVVFIRGRLNPMRQAIWDITDDFVDENFGGSCFVFEIHSKHFDYSTRALRCRLPHSIPMFYLMDTWEKFPKESFSTLIAPVDPREEPIKLVSVYDFDRLVKLFAPEDYSESVAISNAAKAAFCIAQPQFSVFCAADFTYQLVSPEDS